MYLKRSSGRIISGAAEHFLQENISRLENEIEAYHRESEEITENLSRSAEEIHKKEDGIEELKKAVTECTGKEEVLDVDVSNGRKKRKNAVPATSLFSKRGIISLKRHRCLIKSVSVCAVRQKKSKSSGNPRFPICGKNMKSHRTMPFSTEKRS